MAGARYVKTDTVELEVNEFVLRDRAVDLADPSDPSDPPEDPPEMRGRRAGGNFTEYIVWIYSEVATTELDTSAT